MSKIAYCLLRLLDHLGQVERYFWAETVTHALPWALRCFFWSMWSGENRVATVRGLRFVCIDLFDGLQHGRIILRAFQGIGGAGTYSLVFVIFFEMVPTQKYATYTSMLSGVFAFATLLGPLLGGIISNYTTWRWVFLLKLDN